MRATAALRIYIIDQLPSWPNYIISNAFMEYKEGGGVDKLYIYIYIYLHMILSINKHWVNKSV